MSKKVILFQGDSVTDCDRRRNDTNNYSLGFGYATMSKAELGVKYPGEYECYNRGCSGDRIFNVYTRAANDIFAINPDYLSLLIGVNDVWHGLKEGLNTGTERFRNIYKLFIEDIQKTLPNTKLIILEPFVLQGSATENTEDFPDRFEKFDKNTREIAATVKQVAQEKNLKFVSLQCVFDEACKKAPADNWLIDGVHPTASGHLLIKNEWMKAFEEIK